MDIIQRINETPSPETMEEIEATQEYQLLMHKYDEYTKLTLNGNHGSTAQYWMMYVKFVSLFLRFNRACRSNDLDSFV